MVEIILAGCWVIYLFWALFFTFGFLAWQLKKTKDRLAILDMKRKWYWTYSCLVRMESESVRKNNDL
jgi:hypothetical protein